MTDTEMQTAFDFDAEVERQKALVTAFRGQRDAEAAERDAKLSDALARVNAVLGNIPGYVRLTLEGGTVRGGYMAAGAEKPVVSFRREYADTDGVTGAPVFVVTRGNDTSLTRRYTPTATPRHRRAMFDYFVALSVFARPEDVLATVAEDPQ